jgi:hypothetical protein
VGLGGASGATAAKPPGVETMGEDAVQNSTVSFLVFAATET